MKINLTILEIEPRFSVYYNQVIRINRFIRISQENKPDQGDNMNDKQELTIREFAKALGYSQSGIKNWIANDKIESRLAQIKQRPTRLIPVSELERIKQEQNKSYISPSPIKDNLFQPDFAGQNSQDKLVPQYSDNLVNIFRESVSGEIQALKEENQKLWDIVNKRLSKPYLDPWKAVIEKTGQLFLFLLSPFNDAKMKKLNL